jgi:hypothetical protein
MCLPGIPPLADSSERKRIHTEQGVITMLRNFASSKALSLRRTALAGAVAVVAAASSVGRTTPADALAIHHGGGGGFSHGSFGGFNHGSFGGHDGFRDFHHGFEHRFAFGGFGFYPGYYDGYAAYDGCLRRVWGPYGWRLVNVCY